MTHLIDKSALVEEIKKLKAELPKNRGYKRNAYNHVLHIIDSFEVKEVDLDIQTFAKEMETIFALPSSETKNIEEEPLNWEYAIAKHFFELGLKTQKG